MVFIINDIFFSCLDIISYCSGENGNQKSKCYCGEKGFFFFKRLLRSLSKLSNCEMKLSLIVCRPPLREKMAGFWSIALTWFVNICFWNSAQYCITNISAAAHFAPLYYLKSFHWPYWQVLWSEIHNLSHTHYHLIPGTYGCEITGGSVYVENKLISHRKKHQMNNYSKLSV